MQLPTHIVLIDNMVGEQVTKCNTQTRYQRTLFRSHPPTPPQPTFISHRSIETFTFPSFSLSLSSLPQRVRRPALTLTLNHGVSPLAVSPLFVLCACVRVYILSSTSRWCVDGVGLTVGYRLFIFIYNSYVIVVFISHTDHFFLFLMFVFPSVSCVLVVGLRLICCISITCLFVSFCLLYVHGVSQQKLKAGLVIDFTQLTSASNSVLYVKRDSVQKQTNKHSNNAKI